MRILVIPPDLAQAPYVLDSYGDAQRLQLILQELVGGYVERVRIGDWLRRERFEDCVMVVNEEGMLQGLPFNHRASIFYGKPIHGQGIFGTAVIVGEGLVDEGGGDIGVDFKDLPEEKGLEFWRDLYFKLNDAALNAW